MYIYIYIFIYIKESHDFNNFNKHAKFTIIDQLMNTSKPKETLALSPSDLSKEKIFGF